MKLCFPVERDEGLDSVVFGHFGSAPAFIVVDAGTKEVQTVVNRDSHHAHGACSPLKAISGERVDAVIAGGIGPGALAGLNSAGIKVYKAFPGTILQNLKAFELDRLPRFAPGHTCAGHGDCAH